MNLERKFIPSPEFVRQTSKSAAGDGRDVALKSAAVALGIESVREASDGDGLLVRAILHAGVNYQALKTYLKNRTFKVLRGQNAKAGVAGEIRSVDCDDSKREISVVACVDDPSEKLKCVEGLYTTVALGADGADLLDTTETR
jgi:hypothetical protein